MTFHPEPEPIAGPDQVADEQHRLDAKIASRVDIRMERHPDETREQALAALEQVDADNEAVPKPELPPAFAPGNFGGDDEDDDELDGDTDG